MATSTLTDSNPKPNPLNRKFIAESLKQAAAFHFFRYGYSVSFELGIQSWGRRRVDVIGSKISGDLVIVEVKSSVADFSTDHKWTEYLPYADRVYLIFTKEVARKINLKPELKARIPKRVGVMVLGDDGYVKTVRHAQRIEVDPAIRLSVVSRLAWRNGELSKRTTAARKRVFLDETSRLEFESKPKNKPARKVRKRRSRRYTKNR